MGTRGLRKNKPIEYEHISTNILISKANNCNNCPLKLYTKENSKVILGIGNIYSNTMMILPSYNINAKVGYNTILKLLETKYKEITGTDLFEDCYVTRFIKCYDISQYDINTCVWYKCCHYLAYELSRLKPNKIILFSKDYNDFIKCYNYGINKQIFNVINPAVLYYNNDELKQKFIEQLKEAL